MEAHKDGNVTVEVLQERYLSWGWRLPSSLEEYLERTEPHQSEMLHLVIKRACSTQEGLQKKGMQLVLRCCLCNLTWGNKTFIPTLQILYTDLEACPQYHRLQLDYA